MPAARRPRPSPAAPASGEAPEPTAGSGASEHAGDHDAPEVEVRRSQRRRKTVSAHWSGQRIILQVPARMPAREVARWSERMSARLIAQRERTRAAAAARGSDAHLMRRARELSARLLDGRAQPTDVVWSSRQTTRWASATPATGRIRVSDRLRDAPEWVLDTVLHHELCHLIEAGHGPEFRRLEALHPDMARAQAFLDGAAWALGEDGQRPLSPDPEPESGSESGPDPEPGAESGSASGP